jgi:uridine kinase
MSNPELMVAVAGPTSSGKTSLLRNLEAVYGPEMSAYTQDYYLWPRKTEHVRELVQRYGLVAYESPAIYRLGAFTLQAMDLKAGRPVLLPSPPPKVIGENFPEEKTVTPTTITLVEGLYPYIDTLSADQFDLRLFLDLPPEEIIRRRQARIPEGSTAPFDTQEYLETVMIEGVEYVLQQKALAHHVIDASRSPQEVTEEVASYIEKARSL